MDEKRFLELFPEPEKNEKEKSEAFFNHMKQQIKPEKCWQTENEKAVISMKKYRKRKMTVVYGATVAACLVVAVVLPNLPKFLKLSEVSMEDTVNNPLNETAKITDSAESAEEDSGHDNVDVQDQQTEDDAEQQDTGESTDNYIEEQEKNAKNNVQQENAEEDTENNAQQENAEEDTESNVQQENAEENKESNVQQKNEGESAESDAQQQNPESNAEEQSAEKNTGSNTKQQGTGEKTAQDTKNSKEKKNTSHAESTKEDKNNSKDKVSTENTVPDSDTKNYPVITDKQDTVVIAEDTAADDSISYDSVVEDIEDDMYDENSDTQKNSNQQDLVLKAALTQWYLDEILVSGSIEDNDSKEESFDTGEIEAVPVESEPETEKTETTTAGAADEAETEAAAEAETTMTAGAAEEEETTAATEAAAETAETTEQTETTENADDMDEVSQDDILEDITLENIEERLEKYAYLYVQNTQDKDCWYQACGEVTADRGDKKLKGSVLLFQKPSNLLSEDNPQQYLAYAYEDSKDVSKLYVRYSVNGESRYYCYKKM